MRKYVIRNCIGEKSEIFAKHRKAARDIISKLNFQPVEIVDNIIKI